MASRVCWSCEDRAHMSPIGGASPCRTGSFWTRTYRCDGCGAASIACLGDEWVDRLDAHDVPQVADASFDEHPEEFAWLPVFVMGRRFEDVPNTVGDAASEAYACYSIRSYRAAILLARSVVEAVAKDKGVTEGSLVRKIDALADKQVISPLTRETAHEIRHMGNDMAHGDFVQEVTEEECDDVLNFMSVLLDAVYQQPAKLTRFREQRERRQAAGRER